MLANIMQDFTPITETPGNGLTAEQLARILQRYHVGARLAQDKDVLEVACGAGSGFGACVGAMSIPISCPMRSASATIVG